MKRSAAWLVNLRDSEPARWAELARALIVATVGLGWWVIDSETANAIVSAVGLLGSILLTRWVRSSVYSRRTVEKLTRRAPRPTPRRPSIVRDNDPAADQPQGPPPAQTPA